MTAGWADLSHFFPSVMWLYVTIIIISSVEHYMFIPVLQSRLIFIVTGTGEEQEKYYSNATVSFQGALSATALEECVCVSWCGHACSSCWSLCPSLHQPHAGRSCNAVICPEWKEAGFWIPSLSCRCVHSWKCIFWCSICRGVGWGVKEAGWKHE